MYYLFLLLICLMGCQKTEKTITTPTAIVSVPPYAYIVKRLCADQLKVETVVPVGSNPHIFEPKPSDVAKMQNVQLLVSIGESFEKKIISIVKNQNSSLQHIDLSTDATLCSDHHHDHGDHVHHHHESDLHFWLSPKIMKAQAKKIYHALCAQFPEHKAMYEQRWEALSYDLDQVDQEITNLLEGKKDHTILVSHAAFAYFCKDYHLNQLSIESDGKEPLARHMHELVQVIEKLGISTIFVQPQHSDKGALALAKRHEMELKEVDPYAEDYLVNMRKIAQLIASDG